MLIILIHEFPSNHDELVAICGRFMDSKPTILQQFVEEMWNIWGVVPTLDPLLCPPDFFPKFAHFVSVFTLKPLNRKLSRRAKSGEILLKTQHFIPPHFTKLNTPPTGFARLPRVQFRATTCNDMCVVVSRRGTSSPPQHSSTHVVAFATLTGNPCHCVQ